MSNWKECLLGDILKFQRGHDLPKTQMAVGEYPVVGSNGIIGYHNEYTTEAPSITIGRSGNTGNPFIVYGKSWSHNTTLYIKEFKGSDPIFVYYLLKILDLGSFAGGSAVPTLNRNHIHTLDISVPPIEEQIRIGQTLRALDDKIEWNNAINHHLEQMAQAIFKSWFVDFEPWGGVMPDDWKEGCLGDIAIITSGKRPPFRRATAANEADIPLIGASSIMGFTNTVLYDEKILITGRVGTHGIIQRYSRPCWVSDNTLVIKSNYYEFTYHQLCRVDFHNMNRGSTQPLITQTDLKNVPIIIPDEATLLDFEEFVGSLMGQCENNIRESECLAETRDTLLPRLMSGELSVANICDAK
ncbi:MAG: restriction endonuclease subunit S [Synergistaceae bacterium]|jgi:type I restriction enzyme S subunit|nr:restriction endonuclease subunit S [Synergistaceae bacterium]